MSLLIRNRRQAPNAYRQKGNHSGGYFGRDISVLDPRLQLLISSVERGSTSGAGGATCLAVAQFDRDHRRGPVVMCTPNDEAPWSIADYVSGDGVVMHRRALFGQSLYKAAPFGLTGGTLAIYGVGVSIDSTSERGGFLRVGNYELAVGLNNADPGQTPGNEMLGLCEAQWWADSNLSMGVGFKHAWMYPYAPLTNNVYFNSTATGWWNTSAGWASTMPSSLYFPGNRWPTAGIRLAFGIAFRANDQSGTDAIWSRYASACNALFPTTTVAGTGHPAMQFRYLRRSIHLPLLAPEGTSFPYVGSGTLQLSGSAPWLKGKHFTASGGLNLSGTAPVAKDKVFAGSGQLTLSGAAVLAKGKDYAGAGGVQTSGAATTVLETNGEHIYVGSGGLNLSGAAPVSKAKVHASVGQLTLSGAAPVAKAKSYVGAGGLALSGAPPVSKGKAYQPTGQFALGGAAVTTFDNAQTNSYVGSGQMTLSGAALLSKGKRYDGAGGVYLSGAAATLYDGPEIYSYAGSGQLALSGQAAWSRGRVYLPVGGVVVAGTALLSRGFAVVAQGGIAVTGAAATRYVVGYGPTKSGERTFAVAVETRGYTVPGESRLWTVLAELRGTST